MIDKQFIVRNKEMAKTNQTSLIYYTCPYVNNYHNIDRINHDPKTNLHEKETVVKLFLKEILIFLIS